MAYELARQCYIANSHNPTDAENQPRALAPMLFHDFIHNDKKPEDCAWKNDAEEQLEFRSASHPSRVTPFSQGLRQKQGWF